MGSEDYESLDYRRINCPFSHYRGSDYRVNIANSNNRMTTGVGDDQSPDYKRMTVDFLIIEVRIIISKFNKDNKIKIWRP